MESSPLDRDLCSAATLWDYNIFQQDPHFFLSSRVFLASKSRGTLIVFFLTWKSSVSKAEKIGNHKIRLSGSTLIWDFGNIALPMFWDLRSTVRLQWVRGAARPTLHLPDDHYEFSIKNSMLERVCRWRRASNGRS